MIYRLFLYSQVRFHCQGSIWNANTFLNPTFYSEESSAQTPLSRTWDNNQTHNNDLSIIGGTCNATPRQPFNRLIKTQWSLRITIEIWLRSECELLLRFLFPVLTMHLLEFVFQRLIWLLIDSSNRWFMAVALSIIKQRSAYNSIRTECI